MDVADAYMSLGRLTRVCFRRRPAISNIGGKNKRPPGSCQ